MDSTVTEKSDSLFGEKEPGGRTGCVFWRAPGQRIVRSTCANFVEAEVSSMQASFLGYSTECFILEEESERLRARNSTASWYRLGTLWWGVTDRAAGRQGFQREAELA